MSVHAAAVDAAEGFGHVGGYVAVSGCNHLGDHLHGYSAICSDEGFSVFEVNFVLSQRDFVVADFDFYAEGFRHISNFASEIVGKVAWVEVEVSCHVDW